MRNLRTTLAAYSLAACLVAAFLAPPALAQAAQAPANPRVDARMEGTWDGILEAEGRRLRIELALKNGPDGAEGVMTSVDENLVVPVGVESSGAKLKLDIRMIGGTYDASLNAAGDAFSGVFDNGRGFTATLTLKRR